MATLPLRGAGGPASAPVPIPVLGLGTWQAQGDDGQRAVEHALRAGYRHVDTATGYRNEAAVGAGLRASGVPRDEVFLTTKLPPDHAGRERATLEASLRDLGVDQLDLWLVHWPPGGAATPATWQAFLDLRDEGLVRAVGVSNYSVAQLDELVAATGEAPALNQIPYSPADHDAALLAAHAQRGVVVEGYSPFKRTDLDHPVLAEVAAAHGASPAQVVLAWHVAHGVVVIPKSSSPERIDHNLAALDVHLTADEVARVDGLAG